MLDTVNAPVAMEAAAGKASTQRDLSLTESQWDSILNRKWEAEKQKKKTILVLGLEDSDGVYGAWRDADMSLLPAGLCVWCDIPPRSLIDQCYIHHGSYNF